MIDINCDLGEGTSRASLEKDKKLMAHVTSINLACGFHAGSYQTMGDIVDYALDHNIKIGAHPGYEDKENFGRVAMDLSTRQLKDLLLYQIAGLKSMVEIRGGKLHHVKLHGALYNQCAYDPEMAKAFIEVVKSIDEKLLVYGPFGSVLNQLVIENNLGLVNECFADRRYQAYKLAPRKEDGVIHDVKDVLAHVERMVAHNYILDRQGQKFEVNCQTICVHGDHQESLQVVKVLKNFLEAYEDKNNQ